MRESSKQDNIRNGIEEKLNKKQTLEPYADLKMIEDLKRAKPFDNNTESGIINPRMGVIPPKPKKEEPSKTNIQNKVEPKIENNVDKQQDPKQAIQNVEKSNIQPQMIKKEEVEPIQKVEIKNVQKPDIKQETQRIQEIPQKPLPKPQAKIETKIEPIKVQEELLIEEQVESAVELPQMPARVKRPGIIDIKKILGAPKSVKNLDPDIRTIVAKGLADGIKIYLMEIGVYDVNRGYNASKLPHEITNFIRQTNNSRFNSTNLATRLGVDLDADHEDLEMVKFLSIKDLFDEIGENYPKSQIIRTTEDILDKDSNRFTIFEKKKMEELFEMNGIELPNEED